MLNHAHDTTVEYSRIHDREQAYRMTIARLLDASERYPDDLASAKAQAAAALRQQPLWSELAER